MHKVIVSLLFELKVLVLICIQVFLLVARCFMIHMFYAHVCFSFRISLFDLSEFSISLRSLGIKRHIANSNAISRGFGTDLDLVRPGSSMYGLPPGEFAKTIRISYIFLN